MSEIGVYVKYLYTVVYVFIIIGGRCQIFFIMGRLTQIRSPWDFEILEIYFVIWIIQQLKKNLAMGKFFIFSYINHFYSLKLQEIHRMDRLGDISHKAVYKLYTIRDT
jgi:hypothetical protein